MERLTDMTLPIQSSEYAERIDFKFESGHCRNYAQKRERNKQEDRENG